MASAKTYDEKLLSQAPEVTKADLQDGYNPDLLREPTVKRASTTRTPPLRSDSGTLQQPYHSHDKDLESSAIPKAGVRYTEFRKPWWKTVKGIAIIAVVALVIILAAVLGGVLGSRKSHNSVTTGAAGGDSVPQAPLPSSSSTIGAPGSSPTSQGAGSGNNNTTSSSSSESQTGGGTSQVAGGATGPAAGDAPIVNGGGNGGSNGLEHRAEVLVAGVVLRDLGLHI